ncbi:four helix bundle protein [Phaeodactylibacter xiamenensis]|jgi:four helix bundle protein|uniref:four helix bundle protein n=1 Tax=Phaeodactylibacter xiamenensis TaxID=1524460 RepID=UPI003CCC1AD3
MDNPYHTSSILSQSFDFIKQNLDLIAHFPKSQRFLLGDRLQNLSSNLLEYYIEAYYGSSKSFKREKLLLANLQLEKLRFFWRLAYEKSFISSGQYRLVSEQIQSLGRMTGGWLKKL